MIIAVIGLKGGIGKTTLSVSIAAELVRRKNKVLLVDSDPQSSAEKWAKKAENETDWPTIIGFTEPILHKKQQIPSLVENYDYVVIDTPPFDGGMASSALMVADFALLPITPSGLDLEELERTIELVDKASTINESLQSAIFISNKPIGTVLGREIRELLQEPPFDSIPILESETCSRVQFREITAIGDLIHTYAPRSKAAKEIQNLVTEVINNYG